MELKELQIIERTAQAKCGSSCYVKLDRLKGGQVLLRVTDKDDPDLTSLALMDKGPKLADVSELAQILATEINEPW